MNSYQWTQQARLLQHARTRYFPIYNLQSSSTKTQQACTDFVNTHTHVVAQLVFSIVSLQRSYIQTLQPTTIATHRAIDLNTRFAWSLRVYKLILVLLYIHTQSTTCHRLQTMYTPICRATHPKIKQEFMDILPDSGSFLQIFD